MFFGLFRVVESRRRLAMSSLMAGRVTRSRSAVCAVRELMFVSEAPIVLRSSARPETKRCSWSIRLFSAASCSSTVLRTALRLLMVRPMTASRSARVEVSEARLGEQGVDVAALALEHGDDLARELVDVLGRQGREQRLEAVEEDGQVQGRLRVVEPEHGAVLERPRPPDPLGEGEVALPHQVAVLDRGQGALGQHAGLCDAELHQGVGAVRVDGDLLDLAHPDTRDPDLLAGRHAVTSLNTAL